MSPYIAPETLPPTTPFGPATPPIAGKNRPLWLVVVLASLGLLVVMSVCLWWAQTSSESYVKAAARFKQEVVYARDSLTSELTQQGKGLLSKGSDVIVGRAVQQFEATLALAPQEPMLLGLFSVVPPTVKAQHTKLQDATSQFTTALRTLSASFAYYDGVVERFQPIKNLGLIITTDNQHQLVREWAAFENELKKVAAPAELADVHQKTIELAAVAGVSLAAMTRAYATGSTTTFTAAVAAANKDIKATNEHFTRGVNEVLLVQRDTINQGYDKLGDLLQ